MMKTMAVVAVTVEMLTEVKKSVTDLPPGKPVPITLTSFLWATDNHIDLPAQVTKEPTAVGRLTDDATLRREATHELLWWLFSGKQQRVCLRERGVWKKISTNRVANTFGCKTEVQLGNTCKSTLADVNTLPPLIACIFFVWLTFPPATLQFIIANVKLHYAPQPLKRLPSVVQQDADL